MGQRLWEQIRAELETRPGFELKAFHTKALNIGSVGLDTLKRALLGRRASALEPPARASLAGPRAASTLSQGETLATCLAGNNFTKVPRSGDFQDDATTAREFPGVTFLNIVSEAIYCPA